MATRRLSKLMTLALTGMLLLSLFSTPASAAAPANDGFGAATVVTALPYRTTLNTEQATTASDDPRCAGRGHTVWFRYTPCRDVPLRADTFGSDYDTSLSVYTDTRGLDSLVSFSARAGVTYHFMVGSYSGESGGNLVFRVAKGLELRASVDGEGTFDSSTGAATIGGTVTCSRTADWARISGQLR